MPDSLEEAVSKWISRMERNLRGLKESGEDEELRDTLDTLSKQIAAWQILYEPPTEPMPMMSTDFPRGFRSRTIGGNN